MSEFHPFETRAGSRETRILLICDHAANTVPDCVGGGSLGLSAADMNRHIAFDIGARGVTLAMADILSAPAILSRFSRLVIDPNRGEDDPTLVMRLYDGTLIPANRHADATEITRRKTAFHRPYHQALADTIGGMQADGIDPVLVSIHTFTPQLRGRPPRPWHIGILSADDRRVADPLLARLGSEPDIVVGDNEPYVGKLTGDCMDQHGLQRGLAHVLIEIRNDLVETSVGQQKWAAVLSRALLDVIASPEIKEAI